MKLVFYKTSARAKRRMAERPDGRGAKSLVAYISLTKTAQLSLRTRCPGCNQVFYTQPERKDKKTCCGEECYRSVTDEKRPLSNDYQWVSQRSFAPNIDEPAIVSCPDCANVSRFGFRHAGPSEQNADDRYLGPERWPFCAKCYKKRNPDLASSGPRGATWRKARLHALERDKYKCQHCGLKSKKGLHVHHIKPFRCFKLSAHANRSANLVTLCAACHTSADREARKRWPKSHKDRVVPTPSQSHRGAAWPKARKHALARDENTCQACLSSQRKGLHVHHIVPLREFDDKDAGHALRNLVTLCPACHHAAEAHAKLMWPAKPPSDVPEAILLAYDSLAASWPTAAKTLLRQHLRQTRGRIRMALRVQRPDGSIFRVPLAPRRGGSGDAISPCLPTYPPLTAALKHRIACGHRIARRKLQEDQFCLTNYRHRYHDDFACCCLEKAGIDIKPYSRHDKLFLGDPEMHERAGDKVHAKEREIER